MQKITVFNTRYKGIISESVIEMNDVVLTRILKTTNVVHHELENDLVLVTPKGNYSHNLGLCHALFPDRIIYNNAILYHKTNDNYIGFHGDVRWVDDAKIKQKEISRIAYLNSFE